MNSGSLQLICYILRFNRLHLVHSICFSVTSIFLLPREMKGISNCVSTLFRSPFIYHLFELFSFPYTFSTLGKSFEMQSRKMWCSRPARKHCAFSSHDLSQICSFYLAADVQTVSMDVGWVGKPQSMWFAAVIRLVKQIYLKQVFTTLQPSESLHNMQFS